MQYWEHKITEDPLSLSPLCVLPLVNDGYDSISCHLCCVSPEEQPDLPEKPYEMATCVFAPTSGLSTTLRDILTDRPAVSKYHNFLRGFQMHNEYIQQEHFTRWKGGHGSPACMSPWGQAQGLGISEGHLHILERTEGFCGCLLVLTERREKEGTPHTFQFQ